ncbi:hypothetical protein Cfla_2191 [Cellulomonas flavigena DSM 20109]|uniref:Pyrrolo-quinoline quinone repeat domain-containing protein n=1 Tax=Cellulomonas flavigena (strain ATCC 482 / DSM 20109 / BCRC 11376 / JCM 18109 / NBRC 3775 / NCIMB 8073 / NRS 134) TaxID=446466 RepID=D5UG59_CELFN|nr:PQQ-binding-like beta-propeller repeat protein [Cellulomonas flavigena]ADG75082.1 hypothetical protein Cfla_2191 [Cellulomonas flavigena DSM 20109]
MGAVRPAPRMRPVELVDDDERPWAGVPSARDDEGVRGPGAPASPGTAADERRRRLWVVAVLAVVVGVAAIASGVTERAARARADAFAALPGVVRTLDKAPVERWRVVADGPTPVLAAGGAVVTVSGAQGRWSVRASDPATGDVRWETPVVDEAGSGFESTAVRCLAGDATAADLLCVWTEPNVVYGSAGESTPYQPPTRVLVLGVSDGAQRDAWQVEGRVLGVQRHADDLLVATGTPDRHVVVERRAGADGEVLWSWTSPIALVDDGGLRAAPALTVAGDVVALVAMTTTLLDATSGDVVEEGPPGRQIIVAPLPDGGFATWESAFGGTLREPDGAVRARVPGLPARLVGDTSVDLLLMDIGNRVLGVRASDGSVVWRLPSAMTPVAVADGVAVLAGATSVGAVEGATGRLLWEQELLAEQRTAPLTDGLHVLAPEPEEDGGHALVARGLRDGVESWRVELPDGLVRLTALAGLVVVTTPTEVVVLA